LVVLIVRLLLVLLLLLLLRLLLTRVWLLMRVHALGHAMRMLHSCMRRLHLSVHGGQLIIAMELLVRCGGILLHGHLLCMLSVRQLRVLRHMSVGMRLRVRVVGKLRHVGVGVLRVTILLVLGVAVLRKVRLLLLLLLLVRMVLLLLLLLLLGSLGLRLGLGLSEQGLEGAGHVMPLVLLSVALIDVRLQSRSGRSLSKQMAASSMLVHAQPSHADVIPELAGTGERTGAWRLSLGLRALRGNRSADSSAHASTHARKRPSGSTDRTGCRWGSRGRWNGQHCRARSTGDRSQQTRTGHRRRRGPSSRRGRR
jgi:hypothetical protein